MASKRAVRRKACSGKVRYGSKALAAIAAGRRSTSTHSFIHPYRCDFCGGWHIGHPPHNHRTRRKEFIA